jgi:hypothetical protein
MPNISERDLILSLSSYDGRRGLNVSASGPSVVVALKWPRLVAKAKPRRQQMSLAVGFECICSRGLGVSLFNLFHY